jgi:hypothetical protein
MVGATHARKCSSFEEILSCVQDAYPVADREGPAGGWSWPRNCEVVAASAFIDAEPRGRHWLALKPKSE